MTAEEVFPKDDNQGAAKEVVDEFFGKYADVQLSPSTKARYVLALVPDPLHTNLALDFDRDMEVIQQAAQDEGYTYDSSWLPWQTGNFTSPLPADHQFSAALIKAREACPGVLLFRKSAFPGGDPSGAAPVLVVFVVGEQPTGGLNQAQWNKAIELMSDTQGQKPAWPVASDKTLRILGPSFSGSLPSLDRGLRGSFVEFDSALILSGAITGSRSVESFSDRWRNPPKAGLRADFGSLQENDELQMDRFVRYLHGQHTDAREIAILSEDETAYTDSYSQPGFAHKSGLDGCHKGHCPVRLSYPRDISALRSAYREQSMFASPSTGANQVHSVLQHGGEETSGKDILDTIPSFSGGVAPLEQEAALYGIVSQLRIHHTRYIILRCTNPQDFLFLIRFFHRAYPEARIVTMGSDLLFRREMDTTEFRGVLALSSFPLLPDGPHWSASGRDENPAKAETHRVFESGGAQGTYNAARLLFTLQKVSPDPDSPPLTITVNGALPEYSGPTWQPDANESLHPPTWVTVLGREGYWPVAVLDQQTMPHDGGEGVGDPPRSTMMQLKCGDLPCQAPPYKRGKPPLAWFVCVGLALALIAYQLYGIWRGERTMGMVYFRSSADVPLSTRPYQKAFCWA